MNQLAVSNKVIWLIALLTMIYLLAAWKISSQTPVNDDANSPIVQSKNSQLTDASTPIPSQTPIQAESTQGIAEIFSEPSITHLTQETEIEEDVVSTVGFGEPSNVQVDIVAEAEQDLFIYWEEPPENASNPPSKYLIQWRESYEDFHEDRQKSFRASSVTPFETSSGKRAFSVTVSGIEAYKVRVVATKGTSSIASDEALIYTPSNEIKYLIEELLVRRYQADHPWLTEAWNYINQARFSINATDSPTHAWVSLRWYNGFPLNYTGSTDIESNSAWTDESYLGLYLHEVVHVYTLSNNVAARPGPLGVAHLYFSRLANASAADECKPSELYADAGKYTLFPEDYSNYWVAGCPSIDSNGPTAEAIEVARQAFGGQMPDWLYETYEKPDGSLDLTGLWDEVKAVESDWYRTTIIYQLRKEFGGYCNESVARNSAFGELAVDIDNPWRDGGCNYRNR